MIDVSILDISSRPEIFSVLESKKISQTFHQRSKRAIQDLLLTNDGCGDLAYNFLSVGRNDHARGEICSLSYIFEI